MNTHMEEWSQEATSSLINGYLLKKSPLSTKRNFNEVAMVWRKSRSYNDNPEVQKTCKHTLNVLDYKLVDNEQQLIDTKKISTFQRPLPT